MQTEEAMASSSALAELPENTAIARLQEALNDARALPSWSISLFVGLAVLSFVLLLHLLALLLIGPCAWAAYRRQKQQCGLLPLEDPEPVPAATKELE
jgi:hypothetical protein